MLGILEDLQLYNTSSVIKMPFRLLDLPTEIRLRIFEHILVYPEAIPIAYSSAHGPRRNLWLQLMKSLRHRISLSLILVSKATSADACWVLYARNVFYFGNLKFDCTQSNYARAKCFATFCRRIGPRNTSYLRHLSIDFPSLTGNNTSIDISKLERPSVFITYVRKKCRHISRIEISFASSNALELELASFCKQPEDIYRILNNLDKQFRRLSSLAEIVVHMRAANPVDEVRDHMESLGWKVELSGPDALKNEELEASEYGGWQRRVLRSIQSTDAETFYQSFPGMSRNDSRYLARQRDILSALYREVSASGMRVCARSPFLSACQTWLLWIAYLPKEYEDYSLGNLTERASMRLLEYALDRLG